ncbi:hypothetical protein [Zavarzinia sp.]|jgi:hypothetical protein|uniref:hypothetical protein n=1 Tax=Zavarzinia sp. TaxID=2027920 RepID=UPI0035647D64
MPQTKPKKLRPWPWTAKLSADIHAPDLRATFTARKEPHPFASKTDAETFLHLSLMGLAVLYDPSLDADAKAAKRQVLGDRCKALREAGVRAVAEATAEATR